MSEREVGDVSGQLSGLEPTRDPTQSWFSRDGCVVRLGGRVMVVVAENVIGSWAEGETAIRNALLVQLAEAPRIHLGRLASTFGLSSETVRVIRRKYEAHGLLAVMTPTKQEHHPLAPQVVRRMEQLFAQGKTGVEVVKALRGKASKSSVSKYRCRWEQKQAGYRSQSEPMQAKLPISAKSSSMAAVDVPSRDAPPREPEQGAGTPVTQAGELRARAEPERAASSVTAAEAGELRAPRQREESGYCVSAEGAAGAAASAPVAAFAPPESEGAVAEISEFIPFSAKGVQHVGAWLLVVTIAGRGLYTHLRNREKHRPKGRPLRVAVDAVLAALAIGGKCVENVRRLTTSTIAAMLLTDSAPSATWVRRTLGGYCAGNISEQLVKDVSGELLRGARERTPRGKPVVLFIDNHARAYTGMHELRRIWRMQGKRTYPGAMDYWVHSSEGWPVLPIPVSPNASLPETIKVWVGFLREKLGKNTPLLLAFDRAGAFPGLWKWLRDNGVQFVTYQRAKYRKFRREWFRRHGRPMTLRDVDGKKVKVMVQQGRMNLGAKRGRVRRIRILMPDDSQINVVASSKQSVKWLCQTLFTRWRQENAFKHGVERWGINQLDGRALEDVPAGTMVTNPRRTALEKMLREAREREKKLRLRLQQLHPGHPDRRELKQALATNIAGQKEVRTARRGVPKKIPIEQTKLHGELKQHKREYKLLIDTLRCAAQYAEAELAADLAPKMAIVGEAKRLLQNVFSAPGDIRVSTDAITVSLAPAGNRSERAALAAFFSRFNRRGLCHPGDPHARPVRFRLQVA